MKRNNQILSARLVRVGRTLAHWALNMARMGHVEDETQRWAGPTVAWALAALRDQAAAQSLAVAYQATHGNWSGLLLAVAGLGQPLLVGALPRVWLTRYSGPETSIWAKNWPITPAAWAGLAEV